MSTPEQKPPKPSSARPRRLPIEQYKARQREALDRDLKRMGG